MINVFGVSHRFFHFPEKPNAPIDLFAVNNSIQPTSLYLQWEDEMDYYTMEGVSPPKVIMYLLEYSLQSSSNPFSIKIEIPHDSDKLKQIQVTELRPASRYVFRIRGINSAGIGSPSKVLEIWTKSIPPSVAPFNVSVSLV